MHINLNAIDKMQFERILDTKEINMEIADIFNKFLEKYGGAVVDFEANSINEKSLNDEYYKVLLEDLEISTDEKDDQEIATHYIKNNLKKLDIEKYKNNPYYKNIKISAKKVGNLDLTYLTYKPYDCFLYDDISVDPNSYYEENSHIGYFNEEFKYLAITEDEQIWMSIIPNEIETMTKPIEEAKGKVLTFGLGLGYFAYMCSLKNEVTSITIVENNPVIIDLFKQNILPQFEHKEKIHIINADAFEYKDQKMKNGDYDYVFVDLWHNPNDGLMTYLEFRKNEAEYPDSKFAYWLEEGILGLIRRCLISLLDEEYHGSSDKDYKQSASDTDDVINLLHFHLKGTELLSYSDIKKLLSDESLKSISLNLLK